MLLKISSKRKQKLIETDDENEFAYKNFESYSKYNKIS